MELCATVLLLAAVALPARAQVPAEGGAVPGEIIVKLRAQPDDSGAILRDLERLHSRCRVQQMQSMTPGSQRRRALRGRDQSRLPRRERRLSLRQQRSGAAGGAPEPGRLYRIRVEAQTQGDIQELLQAYRRRPDVEYAELSYIVSICAEPNDPLYASQWALAKIGAAEAWDTCRGSPQIIVAVIDTGIDYNHEDLQGNVWCNEAERNGVAGVDDDDNGYIDDIYGYNFAYNTSDPIDDHGHGTHCAGIIAATGNNGIDITGVCWSARIMPIKILDSQGDGTTADAATAIYYAVDNGADVISGSWGGPDDTQTVRDAISYARQHGVIVIAAAGNEASDVPFYPAAYPQVVAVAATESSDKRWFLSNYGDWVDLAAPGRDIVSLRAAGAAGTSLDPFTGKLSGTSMAAPYVAGACALLLAANPLLTCDEVEQILLTTGDPIAAGTCASNARLNVARAMRAAVPDEAILRFDRPVYAQGDEIAVLLADWDLRDAGTQTVQIETGAGDIEELTLVETDEARGVLRGCITTDSGQARLDDGCLQVEHGQQIVARYLDVDESHPAGQWVQAQAVADYEAPALVQYLVDANGAVAWIDCITSEPTRAQVQYGRIADETLTAKAEDGQWSNRHHIRVAGLTPRALYRFVVVLTDRAGNETIEDNEGDCYSFMAGIDFGGFRVPAVYPTIQAAIDDAWDGDTIWVADGVYSGTGNIDIDFGGKAITLRSENGPQWCIIDCRGEGQAFYFAGGESREALVEGFTIRNGDADFGGAVRCVGSHPTIRNCAFVGNRATDYGGAMDNSYGSSPAVAGCTFESNACLLGRYAGSGGAIANRQTSNPVIEDCTFIGNSAGYCGGAIATFDEAAPRISRCTFQRNSSWFFGGAAANLDQSTPIYTHCVFTDNGSDGDGGAVAGRYDSTTTLVNCILGANHAARDGGALMNYEAAVTLTNCTISGNQAGRQCGGLWSGLGGTLRVEDSVLWANADTQNGLTPEAAQVTAHGEIVVDYSCLQGLSGALGGVGNIGRDPLFVDPNGGDYHLMSEGWRWDAGHRCWTSDAVTSPCIDAGNPSRGLGDEPTVVPDAFGNVPAGNMRINMGAYGGTAEASLAPRD